jgi:hypothetical protein
MKVQLGQVWQACDGMKDGRPLSPSELNWEKSLTIEVISLRRDFEGWRGVILENTFPNPQRQVGEELFYPDTVVKSDNWRVVGCHCAECQKYCSGAQPNRPDGKMICWTCDIK